MSWHPFIFVLSLWAITLFWHRKDSKFDRFSVKWMKSWFNVWSGKISIRLLLVFLFSICTGNDTFIFLLIFNQAPGYGVTKPLIHKMWQILWSIGLNIFNKLRSNSIRCNICANFATNSLVDQRMVSIQYVIPSVSNFVSDLT